MDTTNNQLFKALQLQEEDRLDDAAEIFRSILRDDPANTAALFSLGLLTLKHYKDSTTAIKLAEAGILAAPP